MTEILRRPDLAPGTLVLRGTRRAGSAPAETAHSPATAAAAPAEGTARHEPGVMRDRDAEQLLRQRMREIEEAGERQQREAYDKAYSAGFEEGREAGREQGAIEGDAEGREAYASGLRQLEALAHSLDQSVQKSLDEAEDLVVSLVYETVCKIVGDALATREGVAALVSQALTQLRGKPALLIRVNPLDLELLEEGSAFGVSTEADWRADESVPMGGCIVESEHGTLDARIDTQLNQLKRALLAARHKPADERGE
jgi:flagellar assembly protein FliH